jgi:excinuclease ABC subunit B
MGSGDDDTPLLSILIAGHKTMGKFKLVSDFPPAGDQPQAISALLSGLKQQHQCQTLLGVTGSGKTFTLANVIAEANRPALVLSHNKTLAAQLYSEFKAFFPENAVEYFISYYDYYLPESYIPQTDTYIAKDASINENIERLRLSATSSLLERRDVIVVASVSCIYGLGAPEDYRRMCVELNTGMSIKRNELLRRLVSIQYNRNDTAPEKGEFRVKGDTVDIFEPQREEFVRIAFWGDEIEKISRHECISGRLKAQLDKTMLFPCKHFVMPPERIENAIAQIKAEMRQRVDYFEQSGRLVEAQRIYQRVNYDIEMIREIGYCSGIENYSMYLSERHPGSRPFCLFDFFPKDFITIVDESHVTIPQLGAMYKADRSRKETLVEHGFRLPSALENRPLQFAEFEQLRGDAIFVSATPGEYELKLSGCPVEQINRPTGLLDPAIEIRPLDGQIDDVMAEIRRCAETGGRVLVTTMTKKSAERLADYLNNLGLRTSYLHSELDALTRVRVIAQLREGKFDCLIGINLLREGIDLPEVTLVAILDADKEGFLRSERSLIQVAGRAARNIDGKVILYADKFTPSIRKLIETSHSRRMRQQQFNNLHHIIPKTIVNSNRISIMDAVAGKQKKYSYQDAAAQVFGINEPVGEYGGKAITEQELQELITELEREMIDAAEKLEFERAASLRDQLKKITVSPAASTLGVKRPGQKL